jgi:uncharacterized protein YkwD
MRKRILSCIISVLLALTFCALPSSAAGTKISTPAASYSIEAGKAKKITVTITGDHSGIIVKSSNPAVATAGWSRAYKNGTAILRVKAVAAGRTTITIYRKGTKYSHSFRVNVQAAKPARTGSVGTSNGNSGSNSGGNSGTGKTAETTVQEPEISIGYAEEILGYVNGLRNSVGRGMLVLDPQLNAAAEIRAKELAESFSHTRPDGSKSRTSLLKDDFRTYGENIAAGQKPPEAVFESWQNSPPHYTNMVYSNFTAIGIGMYDDGKTKYWVQQFGG